MPRLVVLSCFACLSLVAACVDTTEPASVAACAPHCSDKTGGSGGLGGSGGGTTGTSETGGQGGIASSDGGATSTGGGQAGSGGGTTGSGGGTAGSGGGTTGSEGGTTGSGGGTTDAGGGTGGGGGSSGSNDAGADAPTVGPETGSLSDTNPPGPDVRRDLAADTPRAEASGLEPRPEPGPDAPPDTPQDLAVDLTPDTSPPRPEAGLEAGNCIQRFKANGYSLGTDASIAACSACKTSGGDSLQKVCTAMIDCLIPVWPCSTSGSCWLDCSNAASADSVGQACVASLTTAACASH